MPHAVVDYSDSLTGAFDRRAFALELHALVVEILDTAIGNCKTRFHRLEESVVGEGTDARAVVVHVELAIARGRTAQTKSRLTRAVLELVERHTAKAHAAWRSTPPWTYGIWARPTPRAWRPPDPPPGGAAGRSDTAYAPMRSSASVMLSGPPASMAARHSSNAARPSSCTRSSPSISSFGTGSVSPSLHTR